MSENLVSIPLLPEFDRITESIEKTGKDVLILSLLDWCEKDDSSSASCVLPPYLYGPFCEYKNVLLNYWKRRSQ